MAAGRSFRRAFGRFRGASRSFHRALRSGSVKEVMQLLASGHLVRPPTTAELIQLMAVVFAIKAARNVYLAVNQQPDELMSAAVGKL